MSGQTSLFAPPAEGAVEVPICPAVLLHGAGAAVREKALFSHRHLPLPPPVIDSEREWRAVLDYAEEAIRSAQCPRAAIDLTPTKRSPYSGYMGRGGPDTVSVTASSRGVEIGLGAGKPLVRWPALIRARSEQREIEPQIARARDLAQAYRYLDYYGRVYADLPWHKDWTPLSLIERLASEVRELGGDPTLLEVHTDYMHQGIAA